MFQDTWGADGDLNGRVAPIGGTWETTPDGFDSMKVVAGRATGTTLGANESQLPLPISAPQFSSDWWLRFTFVPGPNTLGERDSGAWFGDDSVNVFFGVLGNFGSPVPADQIHLLAGNVGAPEIDVTVDVIPPTSEHEIVFQWIASGGHVHLYLDDVEVGTAAGVTIDPTTVRNFQLYCVQETDPIPTTYGLVEVGLGVYPG